MEKIITEEGKTQLIVSNEISKIRGFEDKIELKITKNMYCNAGAQNKIILSKRQIKKIINTLLDLL